MDVNNTSGFFPSQSNGVVAIYTLNTAQEETQEIAYSLDGGYSFIRYAGNPVLSIYSTQFRDPKVIWYQDHWVMVVSYAQEFVIGIFTSPDLKSWTHASNFSHHGLLGLQYECPNLVEMPMEGSAQPMYLLAISINPGAPQGGSATQYFPGSFNGTHFEAVDGAARLLDFGKDDYAGQFFYGIPATEDQIFLAWSSNWQYSQVVPTGNLEEWRSAMSLPRKMHLTNITRLGYDLVSYPYGLEQVQSCVLHQASSLENASVSVDYSQVQSGAVYFKVNVSSIPPNGAAQGTLNFTFSASSTDESVSGGYFFGGDTPLWLNRGKTNGFDNPFFTDKFGTNVLVGAEGTFVLEGVIDRSILEIFVNGGQQYGTITFFPTARLDQLTIASGGLSSGISAEVEVWGLDDAWADMASADGIVYGNATNGKTEPRAGSNCTVYN